MSFRLRPPKYFHRPLNNLETAPALKSDGCMEILWKTKCSKQLITKITPLLFMVWTVNDAQIKFLTFCNHMGFFIWTNLTFNKLALH